MPGHNAQDHVILQERNPLAASANRYLDMRTIAITVVALFAMNTGVAGAAPPCDFKGLSVGDYASPQQIMKNFGIKIYKDRRGINENMFDPNDAASMEFWIREEEVGYFNALEERDIKKGPSCDEKSCEIPYGSIHVGNEPYPIPVGIFVTWDGTGKITTIDVFYSYNDWDEIRELLNTKYGDNWSEDANQMMVSDFQRKDKTTVNAIQLTHIIRGLNEKTGAECKIWAQSVDRIEMHSTSPNIRSVLELGLISKNF
jgi:hypothetical protein